MSSLATSAMSLLGLTGEAIAAQPVASAGIALGAAKPVAQGALGFLEGLDISGAKAETDRSVVRARQDLQAMAEARARRMRKLRLENIARVAGMLPDIYHQVSSGRRLPRNSVVIGGRPRIDLLTQLADSMVNGTLPDDT